MTTDRLGRRRAPKITDSYADCRCCERLFVDKVHDRDVETHHAKDGYCHGCYRTMARNGTCPHEFPASAYRGQFTTEENRAHLAQFFDTIAAAGRRTPAR